MKIKLIERLSRLLGTRKKYVYKLHLPLKKKWFDMTKSGIKKEDYRDISPFWCNMLLLYNGKSKTLESWGLKYAIGEYFFIKSIQGGIKNGIITFKHFDQNIMTYVHQKKDNERIVALEHRGIAIANGNTEWGASESKHYFVIKHGKIL